MKFVRNTMTVMIIAMLAMSPAMADKHGQSADDMAASDQSGSTEQMVSDAWLDGKLESALLFNTELNSFDIDTRVENGTVWLTGEVESGIDKDLAGEVALSVDGIDKVENQLTVNEQAAEKASQSESWMAHSEWRQTVSDATLTAAVKSQLLFNEHTDGLDINVDSMHGAVTLSSTVGSEEESALAEQIAQNAEGSSDVKNRLQVRSDSS